MNKSLMQYIKSNNDLQNGNALDIKLSTSIGGDKNSIQIPENGSFSITFQAGTTFQTIDNDARDGQAVIQMPTSVMEGFLRVSGKAGDSW